MAQVNTVSTLDGLYKKVYGPKGPIIALPEISILQDLVPFQSAQQIGKTYNVPIVVSDEHGFAYGDATETVTLNTEIAATLKEISVDGAQIVGQASLNYAAAAASEKSEAAFMKAGHLVIQNLNTSASKKLEADLLYGRSGIATVSSLSTQDIICTAASWADGLMMGLINAKIDVYTSGGSVRQAGLVVTAINPSTYTLTVTGTTTGIVSTDVVYMYGSYGKSCYGLNYLMTNTGSLFGIDASAYPAWAASSYSASSAALTMAKVLSAAAQGVARGGLSGEAVLLAHPSSWNNLNNDQGALRQYINDDKKATNGFNEITYRGPNGNIKVISHPCVKRGDAFLFDPKSLKRVGSQDISNMTPGRSDEIFMHSQTLSAYLVRVYSNQSIFCEKPASMVKITSIVPS